MFANTERSKCKLAKKTTKNRSFCPVIHAYVVHMYVLITTCLCICVQTAAVLRVIYMYLH